ncbi:MAG: hypothetical protein ACYDB2_03620 [Acidimicrobiales bacterium]
MNEVGRFERILRWYPARWRRRYGQGLAALLEDTYGEHHLPLRVRAPLIRAGTVERAREVGVVGQSVDSTERLRAGSLLVLCGWTLFVVAGTAFAKFSEHWNVATPAAHRTLPTIADTAVQVAGIVSAVAVLGAALLTVPALLRLSRTRGWTSVRRPMLRGVLSIGTSVALLTGLILWAHHVNVHQRNGGLALYGVAASVTGFVVLAAMAIVTSTVITVTRTLDLSRRVLRVVSALALAMTVLMGVIATGTGLWWVNEALYAPHFLANSIGSGIIGTSNALPPALVVASGLMVLGLASALVGSVRVFGGLKRA